MKHDGKAPDFIRVLGGTFSPIGHTSTFLSSPVIKLNPQKDLFTVLKYPSFSMCSDHSSETIVHWPHSGALIVSVGCRNRHTGKAPQIKPLVIPSRDERHDKKQCGPFNNVSSDCRKIFRTGFINFSRYPPVKLCNPRHC